MGLITHNDEEASARWGGRVFRLAPHYNLPPALAATNPEAWDKNCDCQTMCRDNKLAAPYNEVR